VIGASDRGKSTYCRALADTLVSTGAGVGFVDGDIGQKDVGPPAAVSLAFPQSAIPFSALSPVAHFFVGAVSPMGHFSELVIGTRRLADAAASDFVVIDTPGLVSGSGRTLQALQIEALQPDVIVAIEAQSELSPICRAHAHLNLLRLPASARARAKSPARRRRRRQAGFRSYFANARGLVLPLDDLVFQRTLLFTGEPTTDPRNCHTERVEDLTLGVSKSGVMIDRRYLKVVPRHFADDLLCGVVGATGECLGIGLIRHIDFKRRRLDLTTPVGAGDIRALQLGHLYLAADGREIANRRRGAF